jgi:hypothetical protein
VTGTRAPAARRDAVRNYHRILDAAREVLGESGADACMEEIAARAGVGVGTVYRRFADLLTADSAVVYLPPGSGRRQSRVTNIVAPPSAKFATSAPATRPSGEAKPAFSASCEAKLSSASR